MALIHILYQPIRTKNIHKTANTDAELHPASPGDTTPLIDYSVTKHNTKEASKITTNEPLTVDKPISLCDEVQP